MSVCCENHLKLASTLHGQVMYNAFVFQGLISHLRALKSRTVRTHLIKQRQFALLMSLLFSYFEVLRTSSICY